MNFFLDENFPKSAAKYLISIGHQVEDIRSTYKEGISDQKIFEMAQSEKAIFLTTDRDFYQGV